MCLYLLLAYRKFMSKPRLGLQQVLRLLQLNLLEHRDLKALLRGDPPRSRNLITSDTVANRVMFMG